MEASFFVKIMAVQALFHPNSLGFWLGLASVLGCWESWMGDSNLVAVDFVINPTQVPPGLWMCVPAQCACLGWRKGCRVVRRSWELCWALKQAQLHQTPSCSELTGLSALGEGSTGLCSSYPETSMWAGQNTGPVRVHLCKFTFCHQGAPIPRTSPMVRKQRQKTWQKKNPSVSTGSQLLG